MKPSVISVVDRELLEEFRATLENNQLSIGTEFQMEMQQCGFEGQQQLADFFSGMMPDDSEQLVRACFGAADGPGSSRIISLFDSYLSCLARRAASIFTDVAKIRRILEALRRITFHYLALAVEVHDAALREKQAGGLHVEGSTVHNQQEFLAAADYMIGNEANWKVAIIVLELVFGTYTPDAVASAQEEIAQRLLQVAREGDLVGRLSPQRWALCLRQIKSESHANLAALKLRRLFNKAFIIADRATTLKNRIGVVMAPDHGNKADDLYRSALKAVRWSERSEEGIQFYSQAIDVESRRNQHLGSMLYKALFENAMALHYQPQYSMSQKKVIGLEALLRWASPDGYIPPPIIIKLIEQEGIVPQFTQWLLHTALRNFAEFRQQGIDTTMSINLLPQNFSQEELPEIVERAVSLWKVPADRIILEVTESSVLNDIEATMKQIGKLKEIGVKLSMDDFGTGYSSMSYLSHLQIDELKIDQSFVRAMQYSARDRAIVRAIANLATSFDLALVAEGVEVESVADRLRELGCDIIQGYWVSRPQPPEMLLKWWDTKEMGQPLSIP